LEILEAYGDTRSLGDTAAEILNAVEILEAYGDTPSLWRH
jgi:hypothetical protein